ncbi:LytTR family transcriptional regulator [Lactobacillus pentosus]|jgi:DNA-binding LytR/AlgR family response regulator|uniref:HTH LytTR-type domain-containing protein n=1 Tax=Lactiplantibacillus pentosus IG1 TaxID=1042160 RepID=G0M023_LACPE|nr:LytTR family DNA-binding domain-containing protein [Lactiplantibacillus pentosus]MCH4129639.1 LytTR family transcriptional regulator [Lactiplantibacillus sp.]CCC15718.1 putative uncharacterized protein lp_1565 [Lactiplantibacillus pentosus IG1]BBM20263.1 response regulator of the LytR/AlgR family [Lactiplantibacillus plantarum]MCT3284949.1 LytTR family transcriptional regulator [Lactiplantibacillus pentosus]MCT3293199.1 LytTR family transcriptional regulator [Lactiplantibacillus pentosus]
MKVHLIQNSEIDVPRITLEIPDDYPDSDALVAALENLVSAVVTLTVSQRGQLIQLPVTDILFIEATGHQVAAHTRTGVYRVNHSLTAVGDKLPSEFMRVSKSAIVNTRQVYALTKTLTGNLIAFHDSPKQLYASRRYYSPLKYRLEQKGLL